MMLAAENAIETEPRRILTRRLRRGGWRRRTERREASLCVPQDGIVNPVGLRDRVVHQRIFAASSMSVARIVRTITEHLTGYAN